MYGTSFRDPFPNWLKYEDLVFHGMVLTILAIIKVHPKLSGKKR